MGSADPLALVLAIAVLIALALAFAVRATTIESCAVAMLPLSVIWLELGWRLHPDLRLPVMAGIETMSLALLLRASLRWDRRLPLLMAAFALIAWMSTLFALACVGLEGWQHRMIAGAAWSGATLALWASLLRKFFWRLTESRSRLRQRDFSDSRSGSDERNE